MKKTNVFQEAEDALKLQYTGKEIAVILDDEDDEIYEPIQYETDLAQEGVLWVKILLVRICSVGCESTIGQYSSHGAVITLDIETPHGEKEIHLGFTTDAFIK